MIIITIYIYNIYIHIYTRCMTDLFKRNSSIWGRLCGAFFWRMVLYLVSQNSQLVPCMTLGNLQSMWHTISSCHSAGSPLISSLAGIITGTSKWIWICVLYLRNSPPGSAICRLHSVVLKICLVTSPDDVRYSRPAGSCLKLKTRTLPNINNVFSSV